MLIQAMIFSKIGVLICKYLFSFCVSVPVCLLYGLRMSNTCIGRAAVV